MASDCRYRPAGGISAACLCVQSTGLENHAPAAGHENSSSDICASSRPLHLDATVVLASPAAMSPLILKRASASRPSGEWNDDDFDVLADGVVVGRIMKAAAKPADASWLWTLAYGYHEDRTPTHG